MRKTKLLSVVILLSLASCISAIASENRSVKIWIMSKDSVGREADVVLDFEYDCSGRITRIARSIFDGQGYVSSYSYRLRYEDKSIVLIDAQADKTIAEIKGSFEYGYTEFLGSGHVLRFDVADQTLYRGVQTSLAERPIRVSYEHQVINVEYGNSGMSADQMRKYPADVSISQKEGAFSLVQKNDQYRKATSIYIADAKNPRRFSKYYLNKDGIVDELTLRIFEFVYNAEAMGPAKYFNWELVRTIDKYGDFDPLMFGMVFGSIEKTSDIRSLFEP